MGERPPLAILASTTPVEPCRCSRAALSNYSTRQLICRERLRSKNELRASRTAGWELERKRFERLPFSILEPSRPALCETISAVDRPRGVRFKRNLRGLATVRAHRIKHLTRAAVVAASASSAASVFVHSLPTVRPLVGRTSRREGPRFLKVCTTGPHGRLTGSGVHRPKLMRNAIGAFGGGHRSGSSLPGHVNLKQG